MEVAFTFDTSVELEHKPFNKIPGEIESLKNFFKEKSYGDDINKLIIGVICIAPRFEPFFKPRRPNYRTEEKTYMHRGVEITTPAMYLTYDLKLDFEKYLNSERPKPIFAQDALASLDTISKVKKIKDFGLDRFKADFERMFHENGWL